MNDTITQAVVLSIVINLHIQGFMSIISGIIKPVVKIILSTRVSSDITCLREPQLDCNQAVRIDEIRQIYYRSGDDVGRMKTYTIKLLWSEVESFTIWVK